MADTEAYAATLAGQLCTRHTALLATAEDDLAVLRARIALVATFIHNPDHCHNARTALAQTLGLPTPSLPKPRQETPQ